jgi:hypothetical protein
MNCMKVVGVSRAKMNKTGCVPKWNSSHRSDNALHVHCHP